MPTFTKGAFSINLAFTPLTGELGEHDRQIAWELYAGMATRLVLCGPRLERDSSFDPQCALGWLDSLQSFLTDTRALMTRFPMGKVRESNNLAFFLAQLLGLVVCPFLVKWDRLFRIWLAKDTGEFSRSAEMQSDWIEIQDFCASLIDELARAYQFVDIQKAMPPGLREAWGWQVA